MPPALPTMRLRWRWSTSWARSREGKKLSAEDILILYLGTIVGDLKEIRTDIARLDSRIDETNKRIDQTNQRIDEIVKTLSTRIDETNKRIDDLAKRIDASRPPS
jgi:uncharacterized coiled-coil DUF342 family protein